MKDKDKGVPWTCDCCDNANPEYYVRYYIHHGSFEGGKKLFTKLACSEHLTEVIASAMQMQGYPGVVVEDIKGRAKWKHDTFAAHYGMSPEKFKEQLQQPDASCTCYSQEAAEQMVQHFMDNFPNLRDLVRQRQIGTMQNPCNEISIGTDICALGNYTRLERFLKLYEDCNNCYLDNSDLFEHPQRVTAFYEEDEVLRVEIHDGTMFYFTEEALAQAPYDESGQWIVLDISRRVMRLKFTVEVAIPPVPTNLKGLAAPYLEQQPSRAFRKGQGDHIVKFHLHSSTPEEVISRLLQEHIIYAIHLPAGVNPSTKKDRKLREGIDKVVKDVLDSTNISLRTQGRIIP